MQSVTLGIDTSTNQQVTLDYEARAAGTYIIGQQNMGKTTLLENMIVRDIEHGHGVCLLDPHRDLTRMVFARIPAARKEDVILFDPLDTERPLGLNLFACEDANDREQVTRTLTQVMQVFENLWGMSRAETANMAQYVRNCTLTLIANPGYTMVEIPRLLTNKAFRAKLLKNVTNLRVRQFWEEHDALSAHDQQTWVRSTLNKIDELLVDELLYYIVGQSQTAIRFREAMDTGKIVLVMLDEQLKHVTQLIGLVVVGQLLNAALSRTNTMDRRPFHLYADEYPLFETPDFATLIERARKFGVTITIAHQRRGQLTGDRDAPLGAVNMVTFKVTGNDGESLAKEYRAHPQPGEPVLKMLTEPVYDYWTETVWDPPTAKKEYEEAQKQYEEREQALNHELAVTMPWWCKDKTKREYARELLQADLSDPAVILKLSKPFNPWKLWFHHCPTRESLELAIKEQPYMYYPEGYYTESWGGLIRTPVKELVLGKDKDGRSFFRMPDAESDFEYDLANSASPIAKALLVEVKAMMKPLKQRALYWYKSHRGWFVGANGLSCQSCGSYWGGYDGDWETTPFPEAVHFMINKLRLLFDQIDAHAKQKSHLDDLYACRKVFERKKYLYDRPVKTGSIFAKDQDSYYRWEPGPEESMANAEARVAKMLSQLPKYQAHCKILQGKQLVEYTMNTIPSPLTPAMLEDPEVSEQIEAIRQRSRHMYGRPREEVQREIENRQCLDEVLPKLSRKTQRPDEH